jgi:hypothetical protein
MYMEVKIVFNERRKKMKSLKRKIFVLVVSSLALTCHTLAQGGLNAGASAEAGEQPLVNVPSSSKEPVPPAPPPPVVTVSPAANEDAVFEEVAVQEPTFPGTGRKIMSAFVRGKSSTVRKIADRLISTKGVRHGKLTMSTVGKKLT